MYIYESHLGGLYVTEEEKPLEECFCETCGGFDWCIGSADTVEEAATLLQQLLDDGWNASYIERFIKEHWR